MVHAFWLFLVAVSLLNGAAWLRARRSLQRRAGQLPSGIYESRQQQLVLSAIYAAGCAFRSFFPRADVQRIVLVDSWLSSVILGRSVATIAELAFAMQWALWLCELGRISPARQTSVIAACLVPLIVFAEICSWGAVISTSFLGNAIEQSTWTLCGALIIAALWPLRGHADTELRLVVRGAMGVCASFIAFMVNVDVRMYVTRWLEQRAQGTPLLGFVEGLHAAATQWVVTYDHAQWRDEMTWMALYFSVGVWISIAFTFAPHGRPSEAPGA